MTTNNPTPQPAGGEGAPELKPCPFCGEPPVYLTDFEDDKEVPTVHHVFCGLCSMQPGIYGRETKDEAIRLWSTRSVHTGRDSLCLEHQREFTRYVFSGCLACFERDTRSTPIDIAERARRAAERIDALLVRSSDYSKLPGIARLANIITAELKGEGG